MTKNPGTLPGFFVSIDKRSVSIDKRSVSIDKRSVSIDKRSVSIDKRSVSIDKRSVSFDKRYLHVFTIWDLHLFRYNNPLIYFYSLYIINLINNKYITN